MKSFMTHPFAHPCRTWTATGLLSSAACLSAALMLTGCSELEPVGEPVNMDLQVMVNSLQHALRESERSMGDLRVELDSRRQDLSVAVVARAQLEGRLRDIERRLSEARRIIDLQREELVQRRVEREAIVEGRQRSSEGRQKSVAKAKAKSKPKAVPVPNHAPLVDDPQTSIPAPLPTPPALPDAAVPAVGDADGGNAGSAGSPGPTMPPTQIPPPGPTSMAPSVEALPVASASLRSGRSGRAATPAWVPSVAAGTVLEQMWQRVVVQAGDTLYGLAHRYGVSVGALREANGLQHDRIKTGQRMVVPRMQETQVTQETQEAFGSILR